MKVLFMCTANSCRSQMAEAWARRLFPAGWEAASAGLVTYPITDRTLAAMAEAGVTMDGQFSKPFDGFDLDDFDLVVTLSRESGRFLPRLARPERHWRRPIVDPMGLQGDDEELRAAFGRARDEIRGIVLEARTALGGD
ncbi:MAG: arsenate reductase ArsC [Candidatus Latescibacteria bacterium]|nr:arsenate reductase ArsC [Candidatus Latescibacterota bacterium]